MRFFTALLILLLAPGASAAREFSWYVFAKTNGEIFTYGSANAVAAQTPTGHTTTADFGVLWLRARLPRDLVVTPDPTRVPYAVVSGNLTRVKDETAPGESGDWLSPVVEVRPGELRAVFAAASTVQTTSTTVENGVTSVIAIWRTTYTTVEHIIPAKPSDPRFRDIKLRWLAKPGNSITPYTPPTADATRRELEIALIKNAGDLAGIAGILQRNTTPSAFVTRFQNIRTLLLNREQNLKDRWIAAQ